MDRSAVFVDAGYLFAAGGDLCCGTRSRRNLALDAPGLNALLVDLAVRACGLPVLRTYWYDGAKNGVATPSQQAIAALSNVKLRLGRLNTRSQQKGVDALIYRDLMTLARERAVTDAFLLSGDEDLREGVRTAQDMGVRVTLIGIRAASQQFNQSRELVHEADEVVELEQADLAPYFSKVVSPPPPATAASVLPGIATTEQAEQAGKSFMSTWLANALEADVASLGAQRPRIPQPLDIELIRSGESVTQSTFRGRDDLKRAIRRGFWQEFDEARAASVDEDG